jgi:hypothetical protein
MLLVLLVLLALPAVTGCGRTYVLGAGVLAGAAIVSAQERPREEVVVVQDAPLVYVVTPPVAPPPAPPPPSPPSRKPAVLFDTAAARQALEGIDLGACRASGAPRGYGHARVTFGPDGAVLRVSIDSPAGLSGSAVECIGGSLGTASVPPFDGGAVSVPTGFYIR